MFSMFGRQPYLRICSAEGCNESVAAYGDLGATISGWLCPAHNVRVLQRCRTQGCRESEITKVAYIDPDWHCQRHTESEAP